MPLLGFASDIAILSATFILIIIFRKKISKLFTWMPLPRFFVYLISSLPFIIFEENINCLPSGCTLLPPTIPFLFSFVLILGLIIKFTPLKNLWAATLAFSAFGILVEYVVGASHTELRTLEGFFGFFMLFWIGLSYAYLVIVPLTILLAHENRDIRFFTKEKAH